MAYRFRKREWPADIDPELVPLLDAMNAVPGIETISSCCGHGGQPVRIFFRAHRPDGLFFLARCADVRYWEYGYQWSINLSVGDMMNNDDRPLDYILESRGSDGYGVLGDAAYRQSVSLVENMLDHLQIKNFMDGFQLNIAAFAIKAAEKSKDSLDPGDFEDLVEHVQDRAERLGSKVDAGVQAHAFLSLWNYARELEQKLGMPT